MPKKYLIIVILVCVIISNSQAFAIYEAEINPGYHSLYYNIYNTSSGIKALKFGLDYQLNPNFAAVINYTFTPQGEFLSLNTKFKALELELKGYNTIISVLNGYRFSESGGNFRVGPLAVTEISDSFKVKSGVLILFYTSDYVLEDSSEFLYQLGLQYRLFKDRFAFEEIRLELGVSNMVLAENRSGLSLAIRNYW